MIADLPNETSGDLNLESLVADQRVSQPLGYSSGDEAGSLLTAVGLIDVDEGLQTVGSLKIENPEREPTNWTKRMERRFCDLVNRKVDDIASQKELRELERLKVFRRRLKYPLPAAVQLQNYIRRKSLRTLLSKLDEQVERIG